ncbi:MAG TPA: hypothetical protein VFR02_06945 [bacterium]|nr:hypothetical protein [bacterium]
MNWKIPAILLTVGLGTVWARTPTPSTASSPWETVYNKTCGYWLRYPKGVKWERVGDCSFKLTWPETAIIAGMTLTLEVTPVHNGEADVPVDSEDPPTGSLVAGGLKFEKTVEDDRGAGHALVTVTYVALGKTHQYYWVGVLNAVEPSILGTPTPDWDPGKMAEKMFDGVLLGFRPLE